MAVVWVRYTHVLVPSDDVEDRNIICDWMQNFGFEHLACSAHVTNRKRSQGVPGAQAINANAVRNLWEAVYSARPITGIDMNINYPGGGINELPGPIRYHWYNSDAEA